MFSAQELDTANKQIDALRDRVASLEASGVLRGYIDERISP